MQKLQAERPPLFTEKEFWFLIGLTVAYFYQPLFAGQTFFFRDLYLFYYPQHHRLIEMLHTGQWPLWDPNLHGGQPFLGHVLNLVLYPTTLLYLILPDITAFNIEIVFHIMLCAIGAYLLARELRFSPPSALLAGVAYAFCGYSLSCVNLFVRLLALPYIPLLLWSWHRFLQRGTRGSFLASVLFLVAFILSGAVETNIMALLLLFGWTVVFPYEKNIAKRILWFFALLFFGFGISAIQILPTAETVAQSTRSAGYRYAVFSAWPLNPLRIPEFIFPGFFGRTSGIKASDYWGIRIEGTFPYMLSVYFGLVVLFLAVRSPFMKDDSTVMCRRVKIYFFSVAAIGFILSLGDALPFFQWFYHNVPGMNRFRYPLKFLTISLLPISLLAAAACDADFASDKRPGMKMLAVTWGIAASLAAFTLFLTLSGKTAHGLLSAYFQSGTAQTRTGLVESILHAFLIWLLTALLYQSRRRTTRSWHRYAMAFVVASDLLWAGAGVNHFAPRQFLTNTPQLAKTVAAVIGDGRFLRMPDPKNMVFQMPADDVNYMQRWNIETLQNYDAAAYGIPVIYHENFDGVSKKEIAELADKVRGQASWEQRLPILLVSGIRIVLSPETINTPGLRFLGAVRNSSDVNYNLYEVVNSRRNAFVTSWQRARSGEEVLRLFRKPDFDPSREVILQEDSGQHEPACTDTSASSVHASYVSDIRVRYSVENKCPGFLVFSEPYYPGWRISVDGKASKLVKANYAFSAVFLPAGKHDVERTYYPQSLLRGAMVSGGTAFLLVLLLILSKRHG